MCDFFPPIIKIISQSKKGDAKEILLTILERMRRISSKPHTYGYWALFVRVLDTFILLDKEQAYERIDVYVKLELNDYNFKKISKALSKSSPDKALEIAALIKKPSIKCTVLNFIVSQNLNSKKNIAKSYLKNVKRILACSPRQI